MTNIFEISGISPTVQQAERKFAQQQAREQLSRDVSNALTQSMISDEDLAMSMPTTQSPASIAQTAKAAYDRQFAEQRARQASLPAYTQMSPLESSVMFGTTAYEGAPARNIGAMRDMYGQMAAGNALPPAGLLALAAGEIGDYTQSKIMDYLAQGGRAVYGDGRVQGVDFRGRYTGNRDFDPYANNVAGHVSADIEREPKVVLPQYDPALDAKRCPDGYVFDEQLQACRLDTTVPNLPESVDSTAFYQQPYQSTGLLDEDGYEYGVPLIYG